MSKRADLPRQSALECLESQEPCLGAVFCSYTFDPLFFEAQVLRAVLKLQCDPDEQTLDFLREGRAALQKVPVACFVDATARTPGQRLPYDLRLVRARVFHPKLVLQVFANHVSLLLGSGNLTRGGYGDNTELWFPRKLRFDDPDAVAAIDELLQFLIGVESLGGAPSSQLALIRAAIAARLPADRKPLAGRTFKVLHSMHAPLLPAFLELIPRDAEIVRLGVLAPFFERDDQDAANTAEVQSLVHHILLARRSDRAVIELGFGWQGGPMGPPVTVPEIDAGLGQLWVHRVPGDPPTIEYFTPVRYTGKTLRYRDQKAKERTWAREQVEEALAARQVYPATPLVAQGPTRIVAALAAQRELRTWLLPTQRFDEERLVRRQLHAKLLAITTERRGVTATYVLVGSPNASGRALLHPPPAGNVELAVALVFEGAWELPDLAPELVACPPDQLQLIEPSFPAAGVDLGRWIADAVHDPRARELRVTWAESPAPRPLAYRLSYLDQLLSQGAEQPQGEVLFSHFDLRPTSCELTLEVAGDCFSVPIRITDLSALPVDPIEVHYGLAELIALLGRRIGRDRLRHVAAQAGPRGTRTVLETIFGEKFTPTDIFRAWRNIAAELCEEHLSLAAFRHILLGPIGIGCVWQRMREAAGGDLGRETVWFYGAELIKTLREVQISADPDAPAKRAELQRFITELSADLESLVPDIRGRPWIEPILRFFQPVTHTSRSDDSA
ncbi:hypothetical protein [Nannocystis sp. SCPEA4]|uniref:hypothetical protein n=1 Tax=Nannocystis sp. SCPEA4 TaxID=2996787 RepID=UPI00226E83D0|nr:hypothetical protein [Nannocystis sp. SCPEA4]MCY1061836.1 hypothetical protein [Nannocystis sp. SCPEA4]